MNILSGEIFEVSSHQGIALVDIRIGDDEFSSLIINSEATEEYIFKGNKVNLLFKETEISLKRYHEKSIKRQNKVVVEVASIVYGQILSEVKVNYRNSALTAIVLTRILNELALEVGKKAILILRSQEILLSKV